MDKKVLKAIKKVTKVIKMFEEDVILYDGNDTLELDDKGKPINNIREKKIKMAILTPKQKFTLSETISGSYLSNAKEAYYILKETDDFKITENMLLKYKNAIFKIIKIEENYGVFLRMELNINDKRN